MRCSILSILSILSFFLFTGCDRKKEVGFSCVAFEITDGLSAVRAISADGTTLALREKGETFLVDVESGKRRRFLKEVQFGAMAFSTDGKVFAVHDGANIRVFDVAHEQEKMRFEGERGAITGLVYSPDDNLLLSVADKSLKVWDVKSRKVRATLCSKLGITALKFSPDGTTLVWGDGFVAHFWDTVEEIESKRIECDGWLRAVAFSADQKALGIVSARGVLSVYKDDRVWRMNAPGGPLEFSPDGRFLVVGGDEVSVFDYVNSRKKVFPRDESVGKTGIVSVRFLPEEWAINPQVSAVFLEPAGKKWKLDSVPWQEVRFENPTAKKLREDKKRTAEFTALRLQELDAAPQRLRKFFRGTDKEALTDLQTILGQRSTPEIRGKIDTDSPWRDELVKELEKALASKDEDAQRLAAACLSGIPSKRVTEIMVDSLRSQRPYALQFLTSGKGGFNRLDPKHPAALTLEQQREILPALMELVVQDPRRGHTLPDLLVGIPDPRVLPFFFSLLEKHKEIKLGKESQADLAVQGMASASLFRIFYKNKLLDPLPPALQDFNAMVRDPARAADAWREWYKANGKNLVWDEQSKQYRLAPPP